MNDAGTWIGGNKITISDVSQAIEIEYKKSSANGANNGSLKMWLDGTLVDTISNIDNDTRLVEQISLGAVQSLDAGTSGTIYFDQFESRRTSYIGPVSVPATATPTATQTETPTASQTPTSTQTEIPTITPTPTNTETPTPTFTPTSTPLAFLPDSVYSNVSLNLPALPKLQADYSPYQQTTTTTINYEYDALYRLTEANYTSTGSVQASTGDLYQYTYDAVGNRLTETTQYTVNSYLYDSANRLTSVNNVNYTFDNNGNLLSDGVNTYTYDSANRLISVSNQSSVNSYQYNGLGDRLVQDGTQYTLDLNSGLTQVLDDGVNTYTYGLGRISQTNITTEYFLGDALGSVRQLTNNTGDITLANNYAPYGSVSQTFGDAQTSYGFTGEVTDATGNIYLRARYYNPNDGRFLSRDTWAGDVNNPLSLNRWNYVEGNPVNRIDPTGHEGIPPGQAIAYCFGVAVVVVVDGPSLELLCALAAATIIGTIGLQQNPEVVEEVIDNCLVTWEQLLNNVAVNPNPNQGPTPEPEASLQPLPPRIPVGTPQPTEEPSQIVYRNPNPSQHPGALVTGFYPRDPSANKSIEYHVRYGSNPGVKTQYISVTKSLLVAKAKQISGIPIYVIDLNKVVGTVYDLTNEAVLTSVISNPIARNYARASKEIVIDGWIPPDAILQLID